MALAGIRVLEFAGLAPAPFCGMILADFGADVIRVDRAGTSANPDNLARGKRSIAIDLKKGTELVRKLVQKVDVIVEPFRPGVMESLGLGPDVLLKENPSLIYARLTGFGNTGPYSKMAGHDINYIAVSGLLSTFGRANENPIFPGNILGDFAGGGMLCVMGILMALLERTKSGKGQVIDAAMVDGSLYLGSFLFKAIKSGLWAAPRGHNLLDSGAPFYDTYKTKDGKYLAIGALEPHFFAKLIKGLGLDPNTISQYDQGSWPELRRTFEKTIGSKTQSEWQTVFDGTDACVTPVVDITEINNHKHIQSRNLLIPDDTGLLELAPAPKLSRTPAISKVSAQPQPGEHTRVVLAELGVSSQDIASYFASRVVSSSTERSPKL